MQLRVARLCHDCEEIHDAQRCPHCASETFTFITRWIPIPDGRARPPATATPETETYRRLLAGAAPPAGGGRTLKRAIVGMTAIGIAGWWWGRRADTQRVAGPGTSRPSTTPDASPEHAGD
jgi:hypothetical protein